MEKQNLLNTYVNNVDMKEALESINEMIIQKRSAYVVAINVDVIVKIESDNYLKEITDNADMVIVDGKPLIWISRFYNRPIKAKISGSDLVPQICEYAVKKKYSIFIIGGKEGIAEKAKKNLERDLPGIKVVGTYAPPFGFENNEVELNKINELINDAKPDILIVCFGCPKQEKWIYENYKKYYATVSICAGATVDFLAGNVNRAPKWVSDNGFEWLFRFIQEPKRLFRRYFIEDIKIINIVWKYRRKRKC